MYLMVPGEPDDINRKRFRSLLLCLLLCVSSVDFC